MHSERERRISDNRTIGFAEFVGGSGFLWSTIVGSGEKIVDTINTNNPYAKVDVVTFANNYFHDTKLFVSSLVLSALSVLVIGDGFRRMENAESIVQKQQIHKNKS